MKLFSKISILTIALFFLNPTFAIRDMAPLEEKFPQFFRGFSVLEADKPLLEDYRKGKLKKLFETDPRLASKFKELQTKINEIAEANPDSELKKSLKTKIDETLSNVENQTPFTYASLLTLCALSVSEKSEEELLFFQLTGFSNPYNMITKLSHHTPLPPNLLEMLGKITENPADYHRVTHLRGAFDPTDQVEKVVGDLEISHFFPCEPGKDELGFFYLAWTSVLGFAPVPVTFEPDNAELHGIVMSPWGKTCHDLAHKELNPIEKSVQQFIFNILGSYNDQLEKYKKELSSDKKKRYGVNKMTPPIATFGLETYRAFQKSLLAILEESVSSLNPEDSDLPDDVKGFIAGAFDFLHEKNETFFDALTKKTLAETLERWVNESLEETSKKEDQEGPDETSSLQKNPLKTSPITGETPLSDEEIFNIIKGTPRKHFHSRDGSIYFYDQDQHFPEKDISEYTVTRNKFYTELEVIFLDGRIYFLPVPTSYSQNLNLRHDLSILQPAKEFLWTQYEYTLPELPSKDKFLKPEGSGYDEEGFSKEVQECFKKINKGRNLLIGHFLKTAKEIAERENPDGSSIAKTYQESREAALEKLKKTWPDFFETDIESFLSDLDKAQKKDTPEQISEDDQKIPAAPAEAPAEVKKEEEAPAEVEAPAAVEEAL